MPLGSKKLLNLFELVSTGQLNPPAALDIALNRAPFPGEPAPAVPPAPAVNDETTIEKSEETDQVEATATPATTTSAEPTPITTPDQHLELECERIRALANVREVMLTKKKILVFTDTVYCTDPRNNLVHKIGRFRIEIPLFEGVIRWFNLERQVNGFQAPHVKSTGNACLGNMKDLLPQLIGKREFAVATTMAIAFVESVNVNDGWGKHIDLWPVAEGKKKKK